MMIVDVDKPREEPLGSSDAAAGERGDGKRRMASLLLLLLLLPPPLQQHKLNAHWVECI